MDEPDADETNTNSDESKDDDKDPLIFVCRNECYIYNEVGHPNGDPLSNDAIIYDTVVDEIIELGYERNGNYFQCLLPVKGWVYMVDENVLEIMENKESDAHEIIKTETDFDPTLIVEERRDYQRQNMIQFTENPLKCDEDHEMDIPDIASEEKESVFNKLITDYRIIHDIVFYFRRHPFLPGVIFKLIEAGLECMVVFDIFSDIRVVVELQESPLDARLRLIFVGLSVSVAAPYLIAWTVVSKYNSRFFSITEQKQGIIRDADNNKQYITSIRQRLIILCIFVFNIAPIGVLILLALDIYHFFETVFIQPLYYIFTFGKEFRTISFEEAGYYKLRRVSEIFAESLPQALLQAFLLFTGSCVSCETWSVVTALLSSLFVLALWVTVLFFEGRKNGMGFVEYMTVVFQGSIKFVPYLPAIERGTDTGKYINWTKYIFSVDSVGHVAKALNSQHCKLETLKISSATLSHLHRFGCRYFGAMLKNSTKTVDVILSRLEQEIRELFDEYDLDNSKSLDFTEFTHLCLVIKSKSQEPCLKSDIHTVFMELADKHKGQIWKLDLMIKIASSTERINLLDYEYPLLEAYQTNNLKLISFLMGLEYDTQCEESDDKIKRESEFRYCVKHAITSGNIKCALALCEHKGVPLVVRIVSGSDLLPMDDDGKSDPYVRVTIFEQMYSTQYRKATLNPEWNENILFIIPFGRMQSLFEGRYQVGRRRGDSSAYPMYGTIDNTYAMDSSDVLNSTVGGGQYLATGGNISTQAIVESSEPELEVNIFQEVEEEKNKQHSSVVALRTEKVQKMSINNSMANFNRSTMDGDGSSNLTLRMRVFDHDKDSEDDFMGAYKSKISTINDTFEYHKELRCAKLQYMKSKKTRYAGHFTYKVFLNAVQKYQEYGLAYIDNTEEEELFSLANVMEESKEYYSMEDDKKTKKFSVDI